MLDCSKNIAYSYTKNQTQTMHIATNGGLSAKPIGNPCTQHQKHNNTEGNTTYIATLHTQKTGNPMHVAAITPRPQPQLEQHNRVAKHCFASPARSHARHEHEGHRNQFPDRESTALIIPLHLQPVSRSGVNCFDYSTPSPKRTNITKSIIL